jgi:hypothetical protein
MLSVMIFIIVVILAHKVAPREVKEDEHIHGTGQIGPLGTLPLCGVDYFTGCYHAGRLRLY